MRFASQDLRRTFVDFFVDRGHTHAPSASLVPDAMSSTLFTIAGMEQFVPAFLGEARPPAPRAVTVQRCLRVAGAKSDIENVGRTGRHGTFLEMLGNFSFGDYYKRDAIAWAWELLTKTVGLDPERLYVTVHTSDDDAQAIWERDMGLAPGRISRFDDDNFWTMGPTGPCGPSSEIFYDTGPKHASGTGDTGPNLGNRYVELWNLVFQQFDRGRDGSLAELRAKNIDTGAGFERLLAVANGAASMYETDLFTALVDAQPPVGATSLDPVEQLVRRRIVADHARAATFLLADGVYPGNADRGYVLRFLIRRAIRNGRLLGYPGGFLAALVPAVVGTLAPGYPELEAATGRVRTALGAEEATFERTLERGSELLSGLIARSGGAPLRGEDVFTLHDTFGFPSELTREIAGEAGVGIDADGFAAAMGVQRERARADARSKRAVVAVADLPALHSEFAGYAGLESDGRVLAILRDGAPVERLEGGVDEVRLVLDRTSFYAEKGGQIGDRGVILAEPDAAHGTAEPARFDVVDTQFVGDAIAHRGYLAAGSVELGNVLRTAVDPEWRTEIRRHHTSCHLLQRALKDVVGDEVTQAGSYVSPERVRFDFRSPTGALTPDQRRATAARVNELIRADYRIDTEIMRPADALARGAIPLPGEAYGELARIVIAGPSLEFCGGTHAVTTAELGMFFLLTESSVGSGIRRIEGVVSRAAERYAVEQQRLVASLAESLSAQPADLAERVERLQVETRDLERARDAFAARLASADAAAYVAGAESVGATRLVAGIVRESSAEALKVLGAAIRQRFPSGVVALVGIDGPAVALLVTASADAVAAGVHAGNLLRAAAPAVGGKGGGQAASAQGGGKDPAGADAALAAIRTALGG